MIAGVAIYVPRIAASIVTVSVGATSILTCTHPVSQPALIGRVRRQSASPAPRVGLELRPVTERHDGQQLGEKEEAAKQTQAEEALLERSSHGPAAKLNVVRYRQIIIYELRNLTLLGAGRGGLGRSCI